MGPQVTEGLNTVWDPSESGLGGGQREAVNKGRKDPRSRGTLHSCRAPPSTQGLCQGKSLLLGGGEGGHLGLPDITEVGSRDVVYTGNYVLGFAVTSKQSHPKLCPASKVWGFT